MRTILLLIIALSVCLAAAAPVAAAVKPVGQLVEPAITPATPPAVDGSEEILEPPPQPTSEFKSYEPDRGVFKLDLKSEIDGRYLFQQGVLGLAHLGISAIMADGNHFGTKLGLAEDALEYKAGLGIDFGLDQGSQLTFSIPLNLNANLYFNEGSLYGFSPFIGTGLKLNLIGSDFKLGGFGYQLYGGITVGKYNLAFGYDRTVIEGSRLAQGYFLSASLPIKL